MHRQSLPVPAIHHAEETEVSVALATEEQDEAAGRLLKMLAAAKETATTSVNAKDTSIQV